MIWPLYQITIDDKWVESQILDDDFGSKSQEGHNGA